MLRSRFDWKVLFINRDQCFAKAGIEPVEKRFPHTHGRRWRPVAETPANDPKGPYCLAQLERLMPGPLPLGRPS